MLFITEGFAGSSTADRKTLQRVISTVQKITGCPSPTWQKLPPPAALEGPKPSCQSPPTQPTTCSVCYPPADDSYISKPTQPEVASFPVPPTLNTQNLKYDLRNQQSVQSGHYHMYLILLHSLYVAYFIAALFSILLFYLCLFISRVCQYLSECDSVCKFDCEENTDAPQLYCCVQ